MKERARTPSRRAQDSSAQAVPTRSQRVRSNPNQLYEIQIVEEEDYKVKIHYVGYSSIHDEWIRRSDIVLKPPKPSRPSPELSLLSVLACSIKQKLNPSRKEDSAVRIQFPFDTENFQLLKQKGKALRKSRGHDIFTLQQYSDLDELLGERWFLRIANTNGDFSYVILCTIRFYITQPRPILDFNCEHQADGQLTFVPFYVEQQQALVFTFVRGDGNKRKLSNFL